MTLEAIPQFNCLHCPGCGEYIEIPLRIEEDPEAYLLWREHVAQEHKSKCFAAAEFGNGGVTFR
jgi:hypothetical protein